MQRRISLFLRLALACCALVLTLSVTPQAFAQDDDGQNFLSRTLQNALSGAGRDVKITGFKGALSSKATLAKMTIADDEGVWLELDNAELDWSRTALLTGKVKVNKLSAESLTLYRLPKSEETASAPSAEAPGFSIPSLPVSIEIGQLDIGKVDLKQPVMGEAAVLGVTGKASLAGGALDTALEIQRQDKEGTVSLKAAYDPDAKNMAVDLKVQEPQGGLVATLMNLPGLPSVDLTVAGTGPLDNYSADMLLLTDGEQRLKGNVTLRGRDDGGREFTVQAGGDLTALAAPQYRDFLGTDIGIAATGTQGADGSLDLQLLRVKSAALNLEGKVAVDAEGHPSSFDVKGRLASPSGEDRLDLPFADGVSLASADVDLTFDRAKSEDVAGKIEVKAPAAQGFSAEDVALNISGPLKTSGASALTLDFDASGLSASDPGIAQALGKQVTGSAVVQFGDGPVTIKDLKLTGPALELAGNASFQKTDDQGEVTLKAQTSIADLGAFSTLAGMDLAGKADLGVDLAMTLPAGTARLKVTGNGENLATGISAVDGLLNSPAKIDLDVERGADGITLHAMDIGTDALKLTGGGQISSTSGQITYDLHLADAGLLTGTHAGPADLAGALTQSSEGLRITAKGGGQDLALGVPAVDGLLKGGLSIDASLLSPTDGAPVLERAEVQSEGLQISAKGSLDPKAMNLDMSARLANSAVFTGGQAGPLSLTGTVRTEEDGTIHALLSGGGDDIATGIEQVDRLLGKTDITADVTSKGGLVTLKDVHVTTPGVQLTAAGKVQDGAPDVDLKLNLPNSAAALGAKAGPLALEAHVGAADGGYRITAKGTGQSIGIGNPQVDALFAGNSSLDAVVSTGADGKITIEKADFTSAAITTKASGSVLNGKPDVTYEAKLDNLGRLVAGLNGPLSVTGTAKGEDAGIRLAVSADGPAGADAKIDGLVGKPDGSVDLKITGAAPLGLANAFITPQSVSGNARFDLAMQGQPGLEALSGSVRLSGGRFIAPAYNQVIDGIGGTVTLTGGRAQMNLTATPSEGGQISIKGPLTLAAPYNAGLSVVLSKVKVKQADFATTTLNGTVKLEGGLTGGGTVSGRIGLSDTEIRLANAGFGGQEAIPDITHVDEPAASRTTRARAGLLKSDDSSSGSGGSGGDGGLKLNLKIGTDNSIFIRGRGLDAELRGDLQLNGTTSNPVPVGQFSLVRGRLDLLTKRIDLDEGTVTMAGGFEPLLHFVATSQSGSYAVTITIGGTASAPEVTFSANPSLPQDEILSQLFFERSISSLSPLQAAQLASAVATLTGNGNGGVLGSIRDKTGLDDLDVSTSAEGNTTLSAGKYISDKVYTETEVESGGNTSLSINLDLTDNVKAKGSVSTSGNTGLGLFFEKDY
ncbi:translocation/assembly module TamB domain-containing protein [Pseudooceanicola sp. CBS1P-1]|uniref:Translocation and assembly module TamB C-terminal domain-containing protein n=1 Tax=Pseudooceanicola albus TaxID=2692189 RepID=A0A6L7G147_9RHOB|nr:MULTISPECIES: translocation/assembly module TamB domain-containing protein [Pseudooceanicola]MBT9382636.1 translocation/assembly module TamB domain-containing protein [Pseudooceanicola endophyticus]MXN17176.1 hypothetical protein [Pseudooceanicola albus]